MQGENMKYEVLDPYLQYTLENKQNNGNTYSILNSLNIPKSNLSHLFFLKSDKIMSRTGGLRITHQ